MSKNDAYIKGFMMGKDKATYDDSAYFSLDEKSYYKKGYDTGFNGNYVSVTKDTSGNITSMVNGDGTPITPNYNNNEPPMSDGQVISNAFETVGKAQTGKVDAMSFGEYLKTYGVDTDKAYSQAVRGATNDFYRALMTYGKRAENMAGAGLVSSGVSDYGNAAAYAARQGAVADAGEAKLNVDAQQAASFGQYIEGVKANAKAEAKQNAEGRTQLLTSMLTSGLDVDAAMAIVGQSPYFENDEQRAAVKAAIESQAKNNNEIINNADVANVYEVISQKMSSEGATLEGVTAELKALGLYNNDVIDKAANAYTVGNQTTVINNINTALSNSEYNPLVDGAYISNDYLKDLKTQKVLTDETYNAKLGEVQTKNGDFLLNAVDMAHISESAGKDYNQVCEWLGIEASAENAVSGVRKRAQEMYNAGDISKDMYIEFVTKDYSYELDAGLEEKNKGTAVSSAITTLWNDINELEGDDEIFNTVLDNIIDRYDMRVEHKASGTKQMTNVNDNLSYTTHWVDIYLGNLKVCTYEFDVANGWKSGYGNDIDNKSAVIYIPLSDTELSLGITKRSGDKLDSAVEIFGNNTLYGNNRRFDYEMTNGTKGMNKENQSAMAELIRRYIYRRENTVKKVTDNIQSYWFGAKK